MIIYGTRSTALNVQPVLDKCANCGNQNTIAIHIYQQYAHVFWIPFFPMSKIGVSQCSHCKQVLRYKEMPPSLQNTCQEVMKEAKTPIWTFALLAIIAGVVIFSVITGKINDKENAKHILAPRVGDIYEVKVGPKEYTLYKVATVNNDSVFVNINEYATNKKSGVNELKDKGFSSELIGFSKLEVKEMYNRGEIFDIESSR